MWCQSFVENLERTDRHCTPAAGLQVALAKFIAAAAGVVDVHRCAFEVLQQRDAAGRSLSWIGASPDGLLAPAGTPFGASSGTIAAGTSQPAAAQPGAGTSLSSGAAASSRAHSTTVVSDVVADATAELAAGVSELRLAAAPPDPAQWPHLQRFANGKGLLEIKCPHSMCAQALRLVFGKVLQMVSKARVTLQFCCNTDLSNKIASWHIGVAKSPCRIVLMFMSA